MQDGHNAKSVCHAKDTNSRRGSTYRRGGLWWIKYYAPGDGGKPRRESTKSGDRDYAERFLQARIERSDLPIEQVDELVASSVNSIRSRAESSQCTIGAIAELTVSVDLMNRGYDVFRSVSHNSSCDLVAIKGCLVLRIEVKTAQRHVNGWVKQPTIDKTLSDHRALVIRGHGIVFNPPLPA